MLWELFLSAGQGLGTEGGAGKHHEEKHKQTRKGLRGGGCRLESQLEACEILSSQRQTSHARRSMDGILVTELCSVQDSRSTSPIDSICFFIPPFPFWFIGTVCRQQKQQQQQPPQFLSLNEWSCLISCFLRVTARASIMLVGNQSH